MKNHLKSCLLLFITCLGILFSGCEKDLYEDAIVQNSVTKGKIEFVKIDETPFLIPSVQSFNKDYEFLTKNKRSNREGLNLNLDLDHILEYVYANDLKTYSISVVKDFQANEDKYFENLNIYEKNGIYESFVLKYNPLDDTKAFDLKTFTGVLEIFDKNYVSQAIIQYEDGLSKCVKVTMGDWIIIFWGNGDISVGGPCLDGGNGGQNGGISGWTGAGPTGGIAVSTASNTGTGTNGQSGNGSYSGNGISTIPVFVPYPTVTNAAQFIYNLGPEKESAFHLLKNNTQILVNNYIEQNLNNPEELGDVQILLSNVVLITKISQLPVETEESIFNYLIQNVFSVDSKNFVNFEVNYLMQHQDVTLAQFENWFMTPKEGVEDNNNVTLLEDTDLTFPSQNLPAFDDFILAFPSHTDVTLDDSVEVYTLVGGSVLTKYNQGARNTCALRVSRGLNYSGVAIPQIPGVTVKGADNKNYFLVAKNLFTWMKRTFGIPTGSNHLTTVNGGLNGVNFPNLLAGKQGVYIMIAADPIQFEASGHADMYFDNDCDGGCYFNAVGEIFFWELP